MHVRAGGTVILVRKQYRSQASLALASVSTDHNRESANQFLIAYLCRLRYAKSSTPEWAVLAGRSALCTSVNQTIPELGTYR